jgi:hypothetical protein
LKEEFKKIKISHDKELTELKNKLSNYKKEIDALKYMKKSVGKKNKKIKKIVDDKIIAKKLIKKQNIKRKNELI